MRVLEVRRHSLVKDRVHLSQAGVDLARRVGAGTGPFDRVVTSQITRTLETAIAMGFAVRQVRGVAAGLRGRYLERAGATARACSSADRGPRGSRALAMLFLPPSPHAGVKGAMARSAGIEGTQSDKGTPPARAV